MANCSIHRLCVQRVISGLVISLFCSFLSLNHYLNSTVSESVPQSGPITPKPDVNLTKKNPLSGNISKTAKILMLAYMKGGSSFGGRMWMVDNDSMLWYEPLAAYESSNYGRQLTTVDAERVRRTPGEYGSLVRYFQDIFECTYDNLPTEAWLHLFMEFSKDTKPVSDCVRNYFPHNTTRTCVTGMKSEQDQFKMLQYYYINHEAKEFLRGRVIDEDIEVSLNEYLNILFANDTVELSENTNRVIAKVTKRVLCIERMRIEAIKCMHLAIDICKRAKLVVAEVNRLHMADVRPILEQIPDLHVIHYIRDPRASAVSRMSSDFFKSETDIVSWARHMCKILRDDLRERHRLETDFPDSFLQIRYEDLMNEPQKIAQLAYGMVGKMVPREWEQMTAQSLQMNGRNNFLTGWKKNFTIKQQKEVLADCSDVLEELGYSTTIQV